MNSIYIKVDEVSGYDHIFVWDIKNKYVCKYCGVSIISIEQIKLNKCLTEAEKLIKDIIE
jgi:hypothetical protein